MDYRAEQRELRRAARCQRRQLNPLTQKAHARRVMRHLLRQPGLRQARRIALYVAADGELDPAPIRKRLEHSGRHWFLPVIESLSPPTLAFYPDRDPRRRRANRFGIPEPDRRRAAAIQPATLDLILLPLVGFDTRCQRIGMGLGFYDRCLATLSLRPHWRRRPRLIGLAHECQRLEQIPANSWDLPLDAIVTERRYHDCTRKTPGA
jgi:5-formyltetrahydrofolate cyclo-ligase